MSYGKGEAQFFQTTMFDTQTQEAFDHFELIELENLYDSLPRRLNNKAMKCKGNGIRKQSIRHNST